VSIHDRRGGSDVGLSDLLIYDAYRRASLVDHVLDSKSTLSDFSKGMVEEIGDFLEGPYEGRVGPSDEGVKAVLTRKGSIRGAGSFSLAITKKVHVPRRGRRVVFEYRLSNVSNGSLRFLFGSELNLGLKDAHLNRPGEVHGMRQFSLLDPHVPLRAGWTFRRAARIWYFPVETVSDSEQGMERTYQGLSLTFLWLVTLPPGRSWVSGWEMTLELFHG